MRLERQGKTSATLVDIGENQVLYSYSTPVAAFVPGRGYLKTDTYHSVTTSRHINKWIDGSSTTIPQAEINAIADGN